VCTAHGGLGSERVAGWGRPAAADTKQDAPAQANSKQPAATRRAHATATGFFAALAAPLVRAVAPPRWCAPLARAGSSSNGDVHTPGKEWAPMVQVATVPSAETQNLHFGPLYIEYD
jgi:hypothetical protein